MIGALRTDTKSPGYLESPDASYAIAAAEIVAAMNIGSVATLPNGIKGWVAKQDSATESQLLLARSALRAVSNLETSELAQLFAEDTDTFDEWQTSVEQLRMRLE